MKEELCGDCRFALNERPNLELKRRDFDCKGGPALALPIGQDAAGRMMVANIRGGVVGGRDPACGLFKPRELPAGTSLYERIAAAKSSPIMQAFEDHLGGEEPPKGVA